MDSEATHLREPVRTHPNTEYAKDMPDIYDAARKLLTEQPELIEDAWNMPNISAGGSLFRNCCRVGFQGTKGVGCLTQVAAGIAEAETHELTLAIRADKRIPPDHSMISPKNLYVFVAWMRFIDRALMRFPPVNP